MSVLLLKSSQMKHLDESGVFSLIYSQSTLRGMSWQITILVLESTYILNDVSREKYQQKNMHS
jgi:hypothetical protein